MPLRRRANSTNEEVKDYYASVEKRNPWSVKPERPQSARGPMNSPILYLGTYPASTAEVSPRRCPGDRLEVHLFWSVGRRAESPGRAGGAAGVRRSGLPCASTPKWFAFRLQKIGRDRVAEMLPLMRKILADDEGRAGPPGRGRAAHRRARHPRRRGALAPRGRVAEPVHGRALREVATSF